jgi:hypothetical protein
LAWKATLADPNAEAASTIREGIDRVLWAMASPTENLELTRRAAIKWLGAKNRSTQGIVLCGAVTSIQPQGLYFAATLELPGEAKTLVTVVHRSDPSADPDRPFRVGDQILLLGVIVEDPSLDIVGYSGDESLVVWSGAWIVRSP